MRSGINKRNKQEKYLLRGAYEADISVRKV